MANSGNLELPSSGLQLFVPTSHQCDVGVLPSVVLSRSLVQTNARRSELARVRGSCFTYR